MTTSTPTHNTYLSARPNYSNEIAPRQVVPPYFLMQGKMEATTTENASAQRWRRAKILASAREIIAEKGCQSLTMRELAAQSDVTPPTIYNLIGDRSEVLFQSIQESFLVKVRYIDFTAKAQRLNPILLLPDIYWMSNILDPDYAQQVIKEVIHPKEDLYISKRIISQTEMVLFRWIQELEEQGRLRASRSKLYKHAATLMCRHLCETIASWNGKNDRLEKKQLRYDLAAGVSLPLLAISNKSEASNIEDWLESLSVST